MSDLQELWNSDREQLRQVREQLAQLRAALTIAQQRCSDLKLAMGDEAGWFDRYTAERAAHAETRHCLEHALRREQTARDELATAEARVKELEPVLAAARDVAHLHDQGEMANSLLEALANAVDVADGENDDG